MLYETYKLGKIKKSPIRRFYTREELEAYELPRLREICRAENIKPPTMEIFHDKEKMVALLYSYLGYAKKDDIAFYSTEGCQNILGSSEIDNIKQYIRVDIPLRMELYKGQASLCEREQPYIVTSQLEDIGTYAFLADQEGDIQAVLTTKLIGVQKYQLHLSALRMSPDIKAGYFGDWNIIFFKAEDTEEVIKRYLGKSKKKNKLYSISCHLQEVIIKEPLISDEPLVIDYGASYTTAGTYSGMDKAKRIYFSYIEDCECSHNEDINRCSLCPSVVAVRDCSSGIKEDITFCFGEEALNEAKRQRFFVRNSIFYDMKRWVNRYHECISVTDLEGNTCEVERLFIIRQFLLYVIKQAEQQNRKWYKKICFTCSIRQKALFMNMYKDAIPEYEVLEEDVTDEAVAVIYNFLKKSIRDMDYESGVSRNMLVLDCGGGTSDMISCNYCITNKGITSHLDMNIAFAHGDTNFGGNHLTWRILQFLKIRLAEFFTNSVSRAIDELFPDIFSELYERVDKEGVEKVYENFSNIYLSTESIIPTCFELYQNQPESYFLKARGNYYFLWNMAEVIKRNIFYKSGICRLPLRSIFSDYSEKSCFQDFNIFIKKGNLWETNTICPELIFEKEEINLLLKPDIYGFLKNFIEPWYESGKLIDIDRIVLSGQSSKIELFRDVLKEYVAGRKAKSGDNSGCEKKLMCIDGAIAYQQDKKTGRIRTLINHEPARVPYSLTAEDYKSGGDEKILLEKGTQMGEVYNFLSRPIEAEEILFYLKDGTGKEVFNIPYFFKKADYCEIGYEELTINYPFINQEDLDSIKNGELRIFVFADDENWGFSILETARKENVLYSCPLSLVPFEAGEWKIDFFDGRH